MSLESEALTIFWIQQAIESPPTSHITNIVARTIPSYLTTFLWLSHELPKAISARVGGFWASPTPWQTFRTNLLCAVALIAGLWFCIHSCCWTSLILGAIEEFLNARLLLFAMIFEETQCFRVWSHHRIRIVEILTCINQAHRMLRQVAMWSYGHEVH
jgi:hypothetical protein